jgi:hypothetical protein
MDFGWVVLLVVVWVLSAIGEMRKKQGKKPRPRSRAEPASDERDVAVGPAAGRRDLARDLAEGARRAEDALRRWEARQEQREAAPARRPAEVPAARRSTTAPARVDEQRREAYQAIADMLQDRTAETLPDVRPEAAPFERPARRSATISGPSLLTKGGTLETARRPVAALDEPPVRIFESGLDRIERLAPLQRAVLWRELLGPPVGLREDT